MNAPTMLRHAAAAPLLAATLATLGCGSSAGTAEAPPGEVAEIGWEDLVPADFVPPEDPLAEMSLDELNKLYDGSDESMAELARFDQLMSYAPVVPELDGRAVSIPGFVVPLDFDGQTRMDEFLLVPYYGACIHMPPPPANQVLHATSESTVEIEDTYRPVVLSGVLRTETVTSDLAEAGYRIEVTGVAPFEEESAN